MKVIDPTWRSAAPKVRHVKPFDFIRGIGVIGVIAGHALPRDTLSFSALVDWFLVLSGFLITTLLLQEHRETNRVDLRKFYARRSLRLIPSLYVTLAGTVVMGVLLKVLGRTDPLHTLSGLAKEVLAAGAYVHNLVFPTQNGVWLGHLWTLSLEEQFYLVVGALMLWALRRGWIQPLMWALGVGILAVWMLRSGLVPGLVSPVATAIGAQRPDSLMIGTLAALVSGRITELSPRTERILNVGGVVAFVVSVLTVFASTTVASKLGVHIPYLPFVKDASGNEVVDLARYTDQWYWVRWGHSLANLTMAIATFCMFRIASHPLCRVLVNRTLIYVGGSLSYVLYLVHTPVQYAAEKLTGLEPRSLLMFAINMVVPFVVAIPMVRLVERKALEIKSRFAVTASR